MPRPTNSKQWVDEVRNAQRFQLKYGEMRTWKTYKDYYRHKFPGGVLPVNLVFSILQSLLSQIVIKQPSVCITALKPGLENFLAAKVKESLSRYFLRERRTKNELKKVIRDNFFCGNGYIIHGYDSEFGFSEDNKLGDENVSLTQFNKKGFKIEFNSYINPGMPWAMRARPDDVVWPWGCDEPNNAEWFALRKIRPLDDLKADPKYKIPTGLSGTQVQIRTSPEQGTMPDFMDTMLLSKEFIELWEIHDARTGEVIVITENAEESLRQETDQLQIDGLPISMACFNPDPEYIYGVPDTRIIEPQLLELNEIRTQAMKHRRVDIVKLLIKKGVLSPDAINKMMDEDVKAVVETLSEEGDLRSDIVQLAGGATGILQDMAMAADLCRQDIREMVGFSRVQQGEFQGKTHVSAAEVGQVMQKSDIRLDDRRDILADLLVDIVRKDLQAVETFWTTKQVVDIVGPDGVKYWVQYTGPQIRGEYDIVIDPNSEETQTPESRKGDAIAMAKAWTEMNMGAVKAGQPVPAEIQRYFFSQFQGVNVEKLLGQQGIQQEMGSAQQPMPIDAAAKMMMQKMGGQGGPMPIPMGA